MSDQQSRLNEATRKEWRELGFYYCYDAQHTSWRLVGSRAGLLKFCDLVDQYADDPRKNKISEHSHYGPYKYLEMMTWHEAQITDHAVAGPLADLRRLAEICREKLNVAKPCDVITINTEYSKENTATLRFEVQQEKFDPASVDPQLHKK